MKIPGAHWPISLVPGSPVSIVSQGDARKKTWWKISPGDYEKICYKSNSELMPPKALLRESHIRIPSHSIKKDNNPNKT